MLAENVSSSVRRKPLLCRGAKAGAGCEELVRIVAIYFEGNAKISSRHRRTLLRSSRSPVNSICFTGFVPFALSRWSTLLISIQRTSANSTFSFPTARPSSSEKVPITSCFRIVKISAPSAFRLVKGPKARP